MDSGQDNGNDARSTPRPPEFRPPPAPPGSPPAEDHEESVAAAPDPARRPAARRWWHYPARASKALIGLVVAAIVAFMAGVYLPKWFDQTRDVLQLSAAETPDDNPLGVARAYDATLTADEYAASNNTSEDRLRPPEGGVQALIGSYRVIARNVRHDRVVVIGVQATIVSTRPAPSGTAVYAPLDGGVEPVIRIGFDLDSTDLRARVVDADTVIGKQAFFTNNDLPFNPGDTARFVITASASNRLYEWRVRFDVFVDGEVRSVVVPAENQPPFRTTGFATSFAAAFTRKGPVNPADFCVQYLVCGPEGQR